MPLSSVRFVPHEMKTSTIKIFSYENKIIKGVLQNAYFGVDVRFEGMIPLTLLLQKMMNELYFPCEDVCKRHFEGINTEEKGIPFSPETCGGNPLATFKLKVLFRQNASWQGIVAWQDRQEEAFFRSLLELIELIDGALEQQTALSIK